MAEPDQSLSKRHFLSFHNGESQWPTQKPAPQLLDHIPFMSCAHCTNLKVKSVYQGGLVLIIVSLNRGPSVHLRRSIVCPSVL
jgi:hypothetical protein